jgi:hypothetical protein
MILEEFKTSSAIYIGVTFGHAKETNDEKKTKLGSTSIWCSYCL